MFEIVSLDTPTLGDRSYLVHDGRVALVVDPQRDIDRVTEIAARLGVEIRHVFETHIHNDYVTGGAALARATGAAYHVNSDDPVSFERTPIADGDVVDVSPSLRVRAMATPGHTFTHLSYALLVDGEPRAVFTGGSLLYGSTGRPDLLGPDHTDTLVRAQYRSAHRLASELPDDTSVHPTHGFGSFCSATQSEGQDSTIGREKRINPVLTQDEKQYVDELIAQLDAFPAYYAHMGPANLAPRGQPPDLSPPSPADPAELRRRIDAGEWVVDLRTRTLFAAGHLPGALNFGLDGAFATYLGWLIPWGTPLTLLGDTPEQIAEAQRELVRIGIDRPAAAAAGGPAAWSEGGPAGTLPLATFRDLAAPGDGSGGSRVVLDVRSRSEWEDGHVAGAVLVPLYELAGRLADVPAGEIWIHCATGYRAAIAGSLLAAARRRVVVIDDDFANAGAAGVELVGERPAAA